MFNFDDDDDSIMSLISNRYDELRALLENADNIEKKREEKKRKKDQSTGDTSAANVSDDEYCVQFPLEELDDKNVCFGERCERWRMRVIRVLNSPISLSRRHHCKILYNQAEDEFDGFFGSIGLAGWPHAVICDYARLMEQCSWAA